MPPSAVDNITAMVIVLRITEKISRTACSVLYCLS